MGIDLTLRIVCRRGGGSGRRAEGQIRSVCRIRRGPRGGRLQAQAHHRGNRLPIGLRPFGGSPHQQLGRSPLQLRNTGGLPKCSMLVGWAPGGPKPIEIIGAVRPIAEKRSPRPSNGIVQVKLRFHPNSNLY